MRTALTRNLQSLLRQPEPGESVELLGFTPEGDIELPDAFSWHDFAIFLLHVASEIEHSLMVQYLYAAYSLGGADVPEAQRDTVRVWREMILGIAKEEMAHLITVQNLLRAIGGPLHLEREDYPFRGEFYPFQFRLERLSKNSLAKYIFAESPEEWLGTEADEIRARAHQEAGADINRVGKLYKALIKVFSASERIADDQFLVRTVPYQANWDEWGRGYRAGSRGDQSAQNAAGTPDLLIDAVRDRQSAVRALTNIAQQGEAPDRANEPKSHFTRFLEIYRKIDATAAPPSRNVPTDPTTNSVDVVGRTLITNALAGRWCELFNLRYRMLLFRLKHAFFVRAGERTDRPTARGNLIAWTFGEMYHLRTIAGVIIDLPLNDPPASARAGPPFEMPYSISLPDWDSDKWRTHRDLIANSKRLTSLMRSAGDPQSDFLAALESNDALADTIVQDLLRLALAEEGQ